MAPLLLLPHASSVVSSSRGAKMMMGNTTTTSNSRPPMRPRDDGFVHRIGRGRRRGGRGETLTTTFVVSSSFALPPANEVAGFLVGGIMLCVVLRASTLDAVIASAQAKSVARDDDADFGDKKSGEVVVFGRADEKDESVKRVKRGKGNVFILPPSSEGLKEK